MLILTAEFYVRKKTQGQLLVVKQFTLTFYAKLETTDAGTLPKAMASQETSSSSARVGGNIRKNLFLIREPAWHGINQRGRDNG